MNADGPEGAEGTVPADPASQDLPADLPRDAQGWPVLGEISFLRRIGEGSLGVVYYGLHSRLGAEVAVRIIRPDLPPRHKELVDAAFNDLQKVLEIPHDNLVRLLEFRQEGDRRYAVMEFVRGETAAAYLKRVQEDGWPCLSPREAMEIAASATRGLAAAHRAGLVHRDIKPGNIIIPEGNLGQAKLADLGLPSILEYRGDAAGQAAVAAGTPGYAAPEQVADPAASHPSMDVFAMGATVYTLMSGHPPFATINEAAEKEPEPLPEWIQTGPRSLILKCLEKDPSRRFANAEELLLAMDVLLAAGDSQLQRAVPASRSERPPEQPVPAEGQPATASPQEIQSALDFLATRIFAEPQEPVPAAEAPPPPPDEAPPAPAAPEPPPVPSPAAKEEMPLVVVPQWPDAPPAPPQAEAIPAPPAEEEIPLPPPPPTRPAPARASAARRVLVGVLAILLGVSAGAGAYQLLIKRKIDAASTEPGRPDQEVTLPIGLDIEPDPRELRIDGVKVDPRQKTLRLAGGTHRIEAVFEGGARVEESIDLAPGNPATVEIRAQFAVARELERAGRWKEAAVWYERAVRRSRSEEERRLAREGLERSRSPFQILSDPPGASVFLGGRKLGQTPIFLSQMDPGEHILLFRLKGFSEERLTVKVEAGKPGKWEAGLKRLTGSVSIKGLEAGDRVSLVNASGGEILKVDRQDRLPLELKDVPEDEYTIVVERKKHLPGKWRIQVKSDGPAELTVADMKTLPGSLRIVSEPPGAEIMLDGKPAGQTPRLAEDLPAGPHKVRLTHPDRSDWEGTAEVRPDERCELNVPLPPLAGLVVESHPAGASVTGAAQGRTPLEAKVKAGMRTIRLEDPEAGEAERTWKAQPGHEERIRVDLWEERAKALERAGRLLEASQAMRRSAVEGRDALADALERKGRYEAAMKAYSEALGKGDLIKAEEAVRQALAAMPEDHRAKELLKWIPEERERRYREAIERAERSAWRKEWKDAIAAFAEALRNRPGDARAADGLAKARSERVYDVKSFEDLRTISAHKGCTHSVAFSPDGKLLASSGNDRLVKLWDAASGKGIQELSGHSQWVVSVAFGPDGNLLASASNDRTIKIWDLVIGSETRSLSGHQHWISAVAFAPDGKSLASAGGDRTVRIWDVATGRENRSLEGHSMPVWSVAYSPDGRLLASGGGDRLIRIWDVQTGEITRTLRGHAGPVMSVAFSPDGRTLASGSQDATIHIWEPETAREPRVFTGHQHSVGCLAFHPGGKILASGSADRTIRFWDLESGKEIRSITAHAQAVFSVAFNPDGKRLASASEDTTVKIWGVQE